MSKFDDPLAMLPDPKPVKKEEGKKREDIYWKKEPAL